MPSYISEESLAQRWSISRRTLQRWRHSGVGPGFIRLCRRIAYTVEDVEAFEAANKVECRPFNSQS